jgi:pSer/pThr/pTyr-binding forkhead associated (FHA) protein
VHVITLTLLHPVQLTPVQHWTFDESSVVRVGRSTDNQVVLYSAVVSRYHVELRRANAAWELVSLGANGTYFEGKRISQLSVRDGMIFRLARSGPNLQVRFGRPEAQTMTRSIESTKVPISSLNLPFNDDGDKTQSSLKMPTVTVVDSKTAVDRDHSITQSGEKYKQQPRIRDYQGIQLLSQGKVGMTYLGERDGELLLLKTLNSHWINHPQALTLFERQSGQQKRPRKRRRKLLLPRNRLAQVSASRRVNRLVSQNKFEIR